MCVATQHGAMTWLKVIVGTFMVLDNSNTDAFFGFDLFDAKDFTDPYIQVNDYAVKLEHVLLPPICTYANVIGHMASGVMPCDLRAGVVKVLCNVTPKRHGQDLATVFKLSVLLPAALAGRIACKCHHFATARSNAQLPSLRPPVAIVRKSCRGRRHECSNCLVCLVWLS